MRQDHLAANQVSRAAETGRNPLIMSLTKAAAMEVAGRDMPVLAHQVGTLHSHCFYALERPEIADAKENLDVWNEQMGHYRLTPTVSNRPEDLDRELDVMGSNKGDHLMSIYQVCRAKMMPKEEYPKEVKLFAQAWENWKTQGGLMDFTDLIEKCLEDVDEAPGNPDVIFVDEAQDLNLLEMSLLRKWGEVPGYLVLVGDPDQCQPAQTMVDTTGGPVPIEDLDPAIHQVLTWRPGTKGLSGQGKAFPFNVASRRYKGQLVNVRAGNSRSSYTPDHICVAKWREPKPGTRLIWLAQKGEQWRVSSSPMLNRNGSFCPVAKAKADGALELWVLDYAATKEEALAKETVIAAKYGLPRTPIKQRNGAARTRDGLEAASQEDQAGKCLHDHGRKFRHPLWRSGDENPQSGTSKSAEIRACNLMAQVMALPERQGDNEVRWSTVSQLTKTPYEGRVYSLDVAVHHTYVADGIPTHNCLYRWRGSDPAAFLNPPIPQNNRRLLIQSYRVPKQVHGKALAWINQAPNREQIDYRPTEVEGEVRRINATWGNPDRIIRDIERQLDQGKTIMVIASCSYMLQETVAQLREAGIPFHNTQRPNNGQWNPLQKRSGAVSASERLLDWLKLSETGANWNAEETRRFASTMLLSKVFSGRGVQAKLDNLQDEERRGPDDSYLSWDQIHEILQPESLEAALRADMEWYIEAQGKGGKEPARFPVEVARKRGPEELKNTPLLTVGSIHSVKGGEAEVVYIFPDVSNAGYSEWRGSPEGRAATYRQFYVGLTRAKETLVLCQPNERDGSEGLHVPIN